jgi:hypothetical protein
MGLSEKDGMERRAEDRIMAIGGGKVLVEVLGQGESADSGGAKGNPVKGQMTEISGTGARLECSTPIRPGSAVKVQWEDEFWLGEAVHAFKMNGKWSIGLKIRQRLTRLTELRRLMAGLAGGRASGSPTSGASCSPLAGASL